MKTLRFWAVLLTAFAILFVPRIASAIGIEGAVGVWNQGPQGEFSYQGESLIIEDDLEYDKKTKFFGRAKIDMPAVIPNIYIMLTPMRFDGTGNKSVNFDFGGTTFTQNIDFDSELIFNQYDIALYYGMPFLETATLGRFNAEAGLNLRIIDFTATVEQVSKAYIFPLPTIYVGAQFKPVKFINLEAEARGIIYSSNHLYELIGRIKARPFGPIFIAGGYRYENIKIDDSDVDVTVDITIAGPFFEAGMEF